MITSSSSRVPHVSRRTTRLALAAALSFAGSVSAQPYVDQPLTNNVCCTAPHFDGRLAGAWGVTFGPAGPAWVASDFGGRGELLDGSGNAQALSVRMAVPPLFNGGFATGLVFSPGNDFLVSNSFGDMTPARFIFASLDGIIYAWTPRTPPLQQNTFAQIAVNNFNRGAVYTGAALAPTATGDRLYLADLFGAEIDAFDGSFAPADSAFVDPNLPPGFAPYNIRVLGDRIFIAYAVQNALRDDVVPGPGNGLIDTFALDGTFQARLVSHGALDAPWGMALAPSDFGPLSNALLVANFGDGRINAFNPATGDFVGTATDATAAPITIDGLRGIEFGNGAPSQPANTLFYAAAPTFGIVGIFGRIELASACYANCDHSTATPVLNINDFTCFLSKFAMGDPYANCDGSTSFPVFNVNDFTCFLSRFAAGCP